MKLSRRSPCLLLLLLTIVAGLLWRMAPLHLPPFWFKYGGSCLWAVAVYLLLTAIPPSRSPAVVALAAALLAAIVELSRLWHTPATDAFRLTLAGRLLLGRIFSGRNIAAYWLAIAAAWLADRYAVAGRKRS